MSFIDGISTVHNTMQFHKLVTEIGHRNNPLLAAIGRNGIKGTAKDSVKWSAFDYNTIGNETRANLEGQTAPGNGKIFLPENFENTYTIIHEKYGWTYEQATFDEDEPNSSAHALLQEGATLQFASNQMAKKTLFNTSVKPANQTIAPENDGIFTVVNRAGNIKDLAGADLTADDINEVMQMLYEAGALSGNVVAVMSPTMKQKWNKVLKGTRDYIANDEKKANLVIDSVETDFGILSTMIDRNMNNSNFTGAGDSILLADIDKLHLYFKNIKRFNEVTNEAYGGYLFTEALAKTGSSQEFQLYGSFTLEYGHPKHHALIKNIGAIDGGATV